MDTYIDINPETLLKWRSELKKHRGAINLVAEKSKLSHNQVSMMLSGKMRITDSKKSFLIAVNDVLEIITEKKESLSKELKSLNL